MWLTNASSTTSDSAYQRMRLVWSAVDYSSRFVETSESSFNVSADGQLYLFKRPNGSKLEIDMLAWRNFANELCVGILPDTILHIFPEFCTPTMSGLDILANKISDDFQPLGLHQQPKNIQEFSIFFEECRSKVVQYFVSLTNEGAQQALETWFKTDHKILSLIAAIHALCSGPCFRSFQYCELRYSSTPKTTVRNLFFLADGRFALAQPKAKQLSVEYARTLLPFPQSASGALALYFIVVRRIGIELLKLDNLDARAYTLYIWSNTCYTLPSKPKPKPRKSRTPHFWTGPDFDNALRRLTHDNLQASLTFATVRQVVHVVLRTKASDLFCSPEASSTTIEQSLRIGDLRGYANQFGIALPKMDQIRCSSMLLIADVWQAIVGQSNLPAMLGPILSSSHFLPNVRYLSLAETYAYHRVLKVYGDRLNSDAAAQNNVVKILENGNFLEATTVSKTQSSSYCTDLTVEDRWSRRKASQRGYPYDYVWGDAPHAWF